MFCISEKDNLEVHHVKSNEVGAKFILKGTPLGQFDVVKTFKSIKK